MIIGSSGLTVLIPIKHTFAFPILVRYTDGVQLQLVTVDR